jgi:hypothetical protein
MRVEVVGGSIHVSSVFVSSFRSGVGGKGNIGGSSRKTKLATTSMLKRLDFFHSSAEVQHCMKVLSVPKQKLLHARSLCRCPH